ncbi:MAG: FeoB-associated Cys-rich membrane protein [Bacteroidia bacterium]
MNVQFILVAIIFLSAVFYVGRLVYHAVFPKNNGCATGCGKCAANFDNLPSKNQ